MRLDDYLDKGASLGPASPCLTMGENTLTYGDVQQLSWSVAGALRRSGVAAGDKVAILSANDPIAFSCVFGIARAGAVWCPINPRNEAAENRDLLDAVRLHLPDLSRRRLRRWWSRSAGAAEAHHRRLPG